MEKEVIIVPKDKCPLDVLSEMGKQTKDSLIFLHRNTLEKLRHNEGFQFQKNKPIINLLTNKDIKQYPETTTMVDVKSLNTERKPIIAICASNIAFNIMPLDFEDIFFLNIEE